MVAVVALLGVVAVGDAAAAVTERVNVSSAGIQSNGTDDTEMAISADGRYVAFVSDGTTLVSGDTNKASDVFMRDRVTGTTERVSVSSSGEQANGSSGQVGISADGRYVAFVSAATNLVARDTNHTYDVFVRNLKTDRTLRVSVSSTGAQANHSSFDPAISADGRVVAFDSAATRLVAGDTNQVRDVFVHNRATGRTERISVSSAGVQALRRDSSSPGVSADGRLVVFESGARNLVSGDRNHLDDIFVHNRVTGRTKPMSVSSTGWGLQGGIVPTISGDGRFVAFDSASAHLVSGDTNRSEDVFVRDRATGTTRRVSVSSTGVQGNEGCGLSAISADGRFVAFASLASNLVAADTNEFGDVFVRDRVSGTTRRVSVSSPGGQANDHSDDPDISADGRFVGFWSSASNLVAGDTNGNPDIFLRGPLP